MRSLIESISQYLKDLHQQRIDKEQAEWKYLHYND